MDEALEVAYCRFVIGELPSEALPDVATQALVRGIDSPALRELAGTSPGEVRQAADLFRAAVEELGEPLPDRDAALWWLVRRAARQVVSGDLAPYEGALWIWRNAAHEVEEEGDLRIFIGLSSEREDHPDASEQIDAEIVRAAAELLDRPAPRRWLRLQARRGERPATHSTSRGLEAVDLSALGVTAELVEAVAGWAAEYADTHNPDAPGFESQAAAESFVARGRNLASDLQRELGDSWHVEFYPEPIRSPGLRLRAGGR